MGVRWATGRGASVAPISAMRASVTLPRSVIWTFSPGASTTVALAALASPTPGSTLEVGETTAPLTSSMEARMWLCASSLSSQPTAVGVV